MTLFFFEDKYYLGKEVTGAFFGVLVEENMATSVVLEDRKEYCIIEKYNPSLLSDANDRRNRANKFVIIQSASDIYCTLNKINNFVKGNLLAYGLHATTGICMIFTAIALGYTEIYITGIDFFSQYVDAGKELKDSYAFSIDRQSEYAHRSPVTDPFSGWHTQEFEYKCIEFIKSFDNVSFYAISPESKLSELLPLALVLNDNPYILEDKPQGYLKDTVLSKRQEQEQERKQEQKGYIQKIKQKFINNGLSVEWDFLQKNYLIQLVYQTIKIPYIFYKTIIKICLHKK